MAPGYSQKNWVACAACRKHSFCKHNLLKAFVDGLIDTGEKVADLLKTRTQLKTRVQKPYPI